MSREVVEGYDVLAPLGGRRIFNDGRRSHKRSERGGGSCEVYVEEPAVGCMMCGKERGGQWSSE